MVGVNVTTCKKQCINDDDLQLSGMKFSGECRSKQRVERYENAFYKANGQSSWKERFSSFSPCDRLEDATSQYA